MPIRPRFDPKREFVAARDFTFQGKAFAPGDDFPANDIDPRLVSRQYEARAINMKPEKTLDPRVVLTQTGRGHYEITAPWLTEPVKARGKFNAATEQKRVSDEGPPEGWVPVAA